MKMVFFLYENDLWEITLRELLPSKIELGKFVFKWNNHEHHMFMKKNKLVHKTIFLNVVKFFSHLQHMQKLKKKFGTTYVQLLKNMLNDKLQFHQKFSTILRWKKALWCKLTLANIDHPIFYEDSTFTLLRNL